MLIAVYNGGGYTLCKGKRINGRWFAGENTTDGRFVSDRDVKQMWKLTEAQERQIVDDYKDTLRRDMEWQFAKDPTLRENKERWSEKIESITFEDTVKEKEL